MSENPENLREELEQRSTDDLISILRNRDSAEWRSEVFAVVAALLKARGVSPEQVSAMGPEGFEVIESEPTVTVARFFTALAAQVQRMALEGAGLRAWVIDEEGGTIYPGIGARLQVREADAERARELLSGDPVSAEDLPPELAEPPCPACGSANVTSELWEDEGADDQTPSPRARRKWYYICADCHEAWPA
jgi:hypothetical protein